MSEFRGNIEGDTAMSGDMLMLDAIDAVHTEPKAEPKAPEAAKPTPAAKPPKRASNEIMPWKFPVTVDRSRDALLTDFGKETLDDRYLLPGESYQDLFARVAAAYADNAAHAQRLYDHISQLWFMPATPVLSNSGTEIGRAHV